MNRRADQLRLVPGGGQNLQLFTDHFFRKRLPEWEAYRSFDAGPLLEELTSLWERHAPALTAGANEAQTEEDFIKPALKALGHHYKVQTGLRTATGRRQPDYALFADEATRDAAARASGMDVYRNAIAVADAKRFDRPLERQQPDDPQDPVAQIIHYVSITKVRWGILTNGRIWRLYGAEGDLVDGACYEVDLVELIELGDPERFKEFAFFFSASSLRAEPDGLSVLDRALDENRARAARIGDSLERQVFEALPLIARGLLGDESRTREALDAAFEHGLVFLYRVLFCLHAEDRGLLPVDSPHYREYSLRRRRVKLAEDLDRGRRFSRHSTEIYNDLRALFRIVDEGDEDLGVNEYDGGLFSPDEHPYFEGRSIPDPLLAEALDKLYRIDGQQIDYRDLSTRHLGTIYERLLAFQLEADGDNLRLVDSPRRKYTGSYFTPEPVVDLIVERTLEPILVHRSQEIRDQGLRNDDALEAFLNLKVLDPAMGSAHFLNAAAAYIAQFIATDPSYEGGLSRVELQRRVAERCIYGVDLIPMAVELARLAMWLATVKGDEPLTFLTNLRCGDSLVGAEITELMGGNTVFAAQLARDAELLLTEIEAINENPSTDAAQIDRKRRHAAVIAELREALVHHASRAIEPAFPGEEKATLHWALEFPEVFLDESGRPRPDGGFDAIVGNPPYIRIQELGRNLANYCREQYEVAQGAFDAYMVFIERALSLLKPSGRLGFIVPNKFMKLDAASKLRTLLLDEAAVEEIIDFGDVQVFAGATNYTCVLILDRSGRESIKYRKMPLGEAALRTALTNPDSLPASSFRRMDLSAEPWRLVDPDERDVIATMENGSARLDEVCDAIFTGLQTSADAVYILEYRGERDGKSVVYSKASDRELELEPDLLHPLASGTNVQPYAFVGIRQVVLFPYRRVDGDMQLLEPEDLAMTPLTQDYLLEHEERLRGRERGAMDHDGWYAFGRNQNIDKQELPKLGISRLADHLRVSADPNGRIYLDNVNVNGVIPRADISFWVLAALLNSRAIDFVFRRSSVPFRGSFLSANKQFIAPLPIKLPARAEAEELESLAQRLHEHQSGLWCERDGFLDWLAGRLERPIDSLAGKTKIEAYERLSIDELVGVIRKNRGVVREIADTRAFRDDLARELKASVDRLTDIRSRIVADQRAVDNAVFDLYGLSSDHRRKIDSEYD